ncbi:MAG TPA: polysaccharide biosynthesis/export family protein [Candidatus Acidoferrales bacterium]|nr:polysaccharide biosynthesis/export family protein [Candidatus Acidoferrales bacterium]
MNRVILFLAAVALIPCAQNSSAALQSKKPDKNDPPVNTARNNASTGEESKSLSSAATADPAYVIGPEDVLDINIWKEPDVSRTVPVRSDGKISLPLINDVQAAGMTPLQLAQDVTDKLRKFLNEPQVTVIVTAINSQRVFVVGEVIRAGAFPLLPGMTVLQALSSAGGFTTFANAKKIHVMRIVNGKHVEIPFNYKEVLRGDNPDQNIKLEPGDTVVVP